MLVGAVVFALGLVEVVLQATAKPRATSYEHDALLGWRNKARYRGRFRQAEFDTLVRTNAFGMRESEDVRTVPGGARIAVLGDSFVWGHGVDEHQRLTEGLAARLGDGAEVLNFGVGGYGTDQELLQLERDVLPLSPTVVIVVFFLNDLHDIMRSANHLGVPKPRYLLEGDRLRLRGVPVPRVTGWDRTRQARRFGSELRDVLARAWDSAGRTVGARPAVGFLNPEHFDLLRRRQRPAAALHLHRRLCHELADLARANGATLVLAEAPFKEHFASARDVEDVGGAPSDAFDVALTSRHLHVVARELGVPYVDPYPAFAASGGVENFYVLDQHLNARGHALMATLLADAIRPRDGSGRTPTARR